VLLLATVPNLSLKNSPPTGIIIPVRHLITREDTTMKIIYEFLFESGRTERFELSFRDKDMSLDPLPVDNPEQWIRLEHERCAECPLDPATKYCPAARNLAHILQRFRDDHSYCPATIRVTANDRTIEKKGALEAGVTSIMGLIMATSGCPILDYFRPMAFTHLPFANETETILRAVSMYLMAQYMKKTKGETPDWDLRNLGKFYATISKVNAAFSQRIRGMKGSDANVTAVISLDLFAQFGVMTLPDGWSDQIGELFGAYFEGRK
jgi:hypothetical protein